MVRESQLSRRKELGSRPAREGLTGHAFSAQTLRAQDLAGEREGAQEGTAGAEAVRNRGNSLRHPIASDRRMYEPLHPKRGGHGIAARLTWSRKWPFVSC